MQLSAPLPIGAAPPADPSELDENVGRDDKGRIVLAPPLSATAWIGNDFDWGVGTVSRFDTATHREIGRYLTVTCLSNAEGGASACDGAKGCCARDDADRLADRLAGRPERPSAPVVIGGNQQPWRTAVAPSGDAWVANTGTSFLPHQASVTRIATDPSRCVDRNHDGIIQTSHDANGDGSIKVDCNGDQRPDDLATVTIVPCLQGLQQEFFGPDDECVLYTTNPFPSNASQGIESLVWLCRRPGRTPPPSGLRSRGALA